MINVRTLRCACLVLLGVVFSINTVWSQGTFPSKPVRLIVGFPPGGAADTIARFYGEALAKELGQPVMVDNRPGAGTTIAADFAAKATPDGYTLYIGGASLMGGDNALYKNLHYTAADFIPVSQLTGAPLVLATGAKSNITSVADLIEKAKRQPGTLTYSSSGNGVITHLAAVQFMKLANVSLLHIPYKGGAQSAQSVAAGDTQVTFATPASIRPMIESGKVVPIGVTTAKRSGLMPDYPPVAEAGVQGYDISNWYGLFVPRGTPPAVVDRLFNATAKVLNEPNLRRQLGDRGEEVMPSASPPEFASFANREGVRHVQLIEESGARVE